MKLVVAGEGMGSEWGKDFFNHIFKLAGIEPNYENSDESRLLISTMFFNHQPPFQKKLPYITWSGEFFDAPERDYPPLFRVYKPSDPSSFQIPFLVIAYFELVRVKNLSINLEDIRLYKNNYRPHFLAYCASRPVPIRDGLFKLLKERDSTVHGLGKCQNTGQKVDGTWHEMYNVYKDYRFVIAMENNRVTNYVTEKVLNALISGAIPIYWGYPELVKKIFNEKAIIFVQDFESLEECADYIIKVDTIPSLYQQYMNEPRFITDFGKGYFDSNTPCVEYKEMVKILQQNFS